jgi:ABC-type nitrate/sulfonate/bicarbonate transport system permease component
MLVQVLHGVTDVDPVALDTARSYRLGRWARIRYVVWPTVLPYAMTGLRLATAVALILTVTGQMVIGGSVGLGREISVAKESGATASMYAIVVVAGILGLLANLVTRTAERRILRWHQSIRRETPV